MSKKDPDSIRAFLHKFRLMYGCRNIIDRKTMHVCCYKCLRFSKAKPIACYLCWMGMIIYKSCFPAHNHGFLKRYYYCKHLPLLWAYRHSFFKNRKCDKGPIEGVNVCGNISRWYPFWAHLCNLHFGLLCIIAFCLSTVSLGIMQKYLKQIAIFVFFGQCIWSKCPKTYQKSSGIQWWQLWVIFISSLGLENHQFLDFCILPFRPRLAIVLTSMYSTRFFICLS